MTAPLNATDLLVAVLRAAARRMRRAASEDQVLTVDGIDRVAMVTVEGGTDWRDLTRRRCPT